MERDIKEYLESQHWIKFLTRDIPFIRNAIILQSYLKNYKKDIGWNYNPGLSIFEIGIADIYKSREELSDNARNFLKVKNKKAFFERILKERSNLCIQMGKGNRYFVFKNREAKEIKNFISSLGEKNTSKKIKGNPAYTGKIQGSVRVILYRKDLSKINRGEILVTPMTEAFYTPYLKKVKGIITNEGGITCHAAIISRELRIPCITGTKNATKILKTGDIIELDANSGVVKIIKNNEKR